MTTTDSGNNETNLRLYAIYVTLKDEPFIEASLQSIYPFATRIFIVTAVNRAYKGSYVIPDKTFEKVLSFPDPDGKISVTRMWIPDDALARNWAMRALLHHDEYPVVSTAAPAELLQEWLEPPDWFWIIDGDEIYDPATVPAILEYVGKSSARQIMVWYHTYFKTWNYRVVDLAPGTSFVRPGHYFKYSRGLNIPRVIGYLYLIPRIGPPIADKLVGRDFVPPEIGVYHHPAYVGDTRRIEEKLATNRHHDEVLDRWIETVWERWTPGSTNFHPTHPPAFRAAEFVPEEDLPEIVRSRRWPPGYTGRIPSRSSAT